MFQIIKYAEISVIMKKLILDQAKAFQGDLHTFQEEIKGLRNFVQEAELRQSYRNINSEYEKPT